MNDDEVKDDVDPSVDEVDFEPDDELGDLGAAQTKIKKLRAELKEAQKRRDENLAGWQRCKADSINDKRDTMRNAERMVERAKDVFVDELLPTLDSFDMATANESWDAVAEEWKSGMRRIQNQLLDFLDRNGVKRFGKPGETFDPARHEAMQEIEDGDGESHTILKVLRHGYAAGDRIIRPAQVIVRK